MIDASRPTDGRPGATSLVPWSLIPTRWESVEARALKGWSVENLAERASISAFSLASYEDHGDTQIIGGPGLVRLRRAFETEGVVFDHDGVLEIESSAPRAYDQIAEAQMIVASYERFADLRARREGAH